jgi:hypothetical protein
MTNTSPFYATLPVQRRFRALMDAARYAPLPADWTVGIADVVQSTKAIADKRYKAVNMAGAAVIASLTNALGGREFPFAFGGDGASFAVEPGDVALAREALAATAAWADGELGLTLRVALVPVANIRAQGLDVRVARYGPSENLSYAMFSGGGLAWADAAIKRGEFAVTPALAGTWPDLTGLSCRFQEFRAARGLILSLVILPAAGADPAAFRSLTEAIVTLVEASPEAGRPLPARLAAAGGRSRSSYAAGRKPVQTRARAGQDLAVFFGDAVGHQGRQLRAGRLFAPGRRKFRFPQI